MLAMPRSGLGVLEGAWASLGVGALESGAVTTIISGHLSP
jgi:hypothetical protein